jgi:hypothetical protein
LPDLIGFLLHQKRRAPNVKKICRIIFHASIVLMIIFHDDNYEYLMYGAACAHLKKCRYGG